MTRGSQVFTAFYKAGYQTDDCGEQYGAPADGEDASQWGPAACAADGLQWNEIAREYYFYGAEEPTYVTVLDDAPGATEYDQPNDDYQHLNIYALDRSGNIKQTYYRNGTWYAWSDKGGDCSSAPAALAYGGTHLWIFCRPKRQRRDDSGETLGWQCLGLVDQSGRFCPERTRGNRVFPARRRLSP